MKTGGNRASCLFSIDFLAMNARAGTPELEAAAAAIDPESLRAAKQAIALSCEEYLRWIALFEERLQIVQPSELHKFARALALSMLGYLPTRPETCPFCIQYGRDRQCRGCGYAATHGRCDADDSAFSRFIEAFQELGRVIYQDLPGEDPNFDSARSRVMHFLEGSKEAAERWQRSLSEASCSELMRQKAIYLQDKIGMIPAELFSADVGEKKRLVLNALKDYWQIQSDRKG